MDALKRTHKHCKIFIMKHPSCYRITGSVSLETLCKECGWAILSQIKQPHKLSSMYKVYKGMVLPFKQDLIPFFYQ